MMMLAVNTVSSIWVYRDAKALNVRHEANGKFLDFGPPGWTVFCFLLSVVALPLYLFKRPDFKRSSASSPSDSGMIGTDAPVVSGPAQVAAIGGEGATKRSNDEQSKKFTVKLIGIRPEIPLDQAKSKLAVLFKAPADKIDALLSSLPFAVKTGIPEDVAAKYKSAIEAAGGEVRIIDEAPSETLAVEFPADDAKSQTAVNSKTTGYGEQAATSSLTASRARSTDSTGSESKSKRVFGLLGAIVSGIVLWFAGSKLLHTDLTSLTSKPSMLNEVLVIGKSTKADYQKLIDEGGLDRHSEWHGLYVTGLQIRYSGGVMSEIALKIRYKAKYLNSISKWVDGDPVSPKELRETLSPICGLAAGDWTTSDTGGSGETVKSDNRLTCQYNVLNNNGEYLVTVAKSPPAPTASVSPSHPVPPVQGHVSLPAVVRCSEPGKADDISIWAFFPDGTYYFEARWANPGQEPKLWMQQAGQYRQEGNRITTRMIGLVKMPPVYPVWELNPMIVVSTKEMQYVDEDASPTIGTKPPTFKIQEIARTVNGTPASDTGGPVRELCGVIDDPNVDAGAQKMKATIDKKYFGL